MKESNKHTHKIITLCGSTDFKKEFESAASFLSLNGYIVLMPHVFSRYNGNGLSSNVVQQLGKLHKLKIDMSDAIMVINKDGYIGESTKSEIEYAKLKGKKVYYRYISCQGNCKHFKKCIANSKQHFFEIKFSDIYPTCPYYYNSDE